MLRRNKRKSADHGTADQLGSELASEGVRIIRPNEQGETNGAAAGAEQATGSIVADRTAPMPGGSAADDIERDGAVFQPVGSDQTLPNSAELILDQAGRGGRDPLLEPAQRARREDGEAAVADRFATGASAVRIIIGDDLDEGSVATGIDDLPGTLVSGLDVSGLVGGAEDSDVAGDVTTADRRTVVISDDAGSAVSAEQTSNPRRGMDPRFRDRRRAVRRAMGRRRLVALVAGAVALTIVLIVTALLASSLFAVRAPDVTVIGWQHADQTEMQAVLDDLVGTPVLRVDEEAIAQRLEEIAWIDTAHVETKLPNSATVEVAERIPLATYQGPDARYRVLDRDGRVLDMTDGFPVEFVWITSENPPNLEIGQFAPAGFTAAAELSRNFTPRLRPRVQRISVEASGTALVLYLRDGTRVNFGAANELFSKLVRLETLLSNYPDMVDAEIDVSTEETTRASDDLLKIKEAERERRAEAAAEAAAQEAEAVQAEAETTTDETEEATDPAAATDGDATPAEGTLAAAGN